MIESFRQKGLKLLFEEGDPTGVNPQHVEKIENILGLLDVAQDIEDINSRARSQPRSPFKACNRKVGTFWRIIFRFADGRTSDVDLIDYH